MAIIVDLDGQVAVVTGAGGGLGSAISARLAAAGATVIVTDIDMPAAEAVTAEIVASGGHASAFQLDVRNAAAVMACFASLRERFGPTNVLVNNAGNLRNVPFIDMTVDDWDAVIDTHLRGAALCSRAALEGLAETKGAIVSVSSGSIMGSSRGQASYASAKAGIVGLTRTLATELGPSGIRANAVAPGAIVSAMTRATAVQDGLEFDEYCRRVAERVPLGRIGEPHDVADVVVFLGSELSRYVNGETIFVTGGPGRAL